MKTLIQRVNSASVTVAGEIVGQIGKGLVLLTGFGKEDDSSKLAPMAEKIVNMRIFPDEEARFHLSLRDISGSVLIVPQFTLYADTKKGRRPEFFEALEPKGAEVLYEEFLNIFHKIGISKVAGGYFGAHMLVSLENNGPVTIMLES